MGEWECLIVLLFEMNFVASIFEKDSRETGETCLPISISLISLHENKERIGHCEPHTTLESSQAAPSSPMGTLTC